MKSVTFALIAILFSAFHSFGQSYSIQSVENVPKIVVVGRGTVTAFPNAAQLSISIVFTKPTLREAIDENQKTADAAVAIIKKYVTNPTDIRNSFISTAKTYRYDAALKKDVAAGFEARQNVIFTLKDLANLQVLTEELLKTKFYGIDRISYFNTNGTELAKSAQEMAVTDAMETTDRMAKAGKIKLGKVVFLQTDNSPTDAGSTSYDAYQFQTYGKGRAAAA